MDKIIYRNLLQSLHRMPHCANANLSEIDIEYYQKMYFQKSWAWWVNHIGTIVVFFIGFFGNLLCLLVLCRRRLRRNSYTQYLIALAIIDSGAILCEALTALDEIHHSQTMNRRTFFHHTDLTCKLYYYIRYVLYSMSSWIIVALAIERLVAIRFPLWSKHICSVVNARRILLIILFFTMNIQFYHLIVRGLDCSNSTLKQPTQNCRCKTLPEYAKLEVILTIYVWRLTLMTLLPLTIIITVNISIMSKLFNENSLVDHTNLTRNSRKKTILLYKISRMLVLLSSIYLLLHVPGSLLDLLKVIFANAIRICNIKWQYYISLTDAIFDLLTNFNYGINFYLYIISGKHIRNELMYTFKHIPWSKQNDKIQRSSYFMSSYANLTKSPQFHRSPVQLSRQISGTSI